MSVSWPAAAALLLVLLGRLDGTELSGEDTTHHGGSIAASSTTTTAAPIDDYYDGDYEDDQTAEPSTAQPSERRNPLLLPEVKFACLGRSEGYYADVRLRCEVFHYCKPDGVRFSFVCPPKSSFNQKLLICDYDPAAVQVCPDSPNYFYLNHKPAINITGDTLSTSFSPTSTGATDGTSTPTAAERPITVAIPRLRKPVTRPATTPTPRPPDEPLTPGTAYPQPVFGRPNPRITTPSTSTYSSLFKTTTPTSAPAHTVTPSVTAVPAPPTTKLPSPPEQDDEEDWIDDSYPPTRVNILLEPPRVESSRNSSSPWSLQWPPRTSQWFTTRIQPTTTPGTNHSWWTQIPQVTQPVSSVQYSHSAPDRPDYTTQEPSQSYMAEFDRDALFEHFRRTPIDEHMNGRFTNTYNDDGRRMFEHLQSGVTYSQERPSNAAYPSDAQENMQSDQANDGYSPRGMSRDSGANSFVVYDQSHASNDDRPGLYDPYMDHMQRFPQYFNAEDNEEQQQRFPQVHHEGVGRDHSHDDSRNVYAAHVTELKRPEFQSSEINTSPPSTEGSVHMSWANFKDDGTFFDTLASDSVPTTEVPQSDSNGLAPPPWKPMAEVLMGREPSPRLSGSYHKTPSGYFEFRHAWKSSKRKRSSAKRIKRQLLSRLFKRQPMRLTPEPPRVLHVPEDVRWMPFPFGVSGFQAAPNMMRVPPPPPQPPHNFHASHGPQEFQHQPKPPPAVTPHMFPPQQQFRRPPNFVENHATQLKLPGKFSTDQPLPWDFHFNGHPPHEAMMRPDMQRPHHSDMHPGHMHSMQGQDSVPRRPPMEAFFHSTTPSSLHQITHRPVGHQEGINDASHIVGHSDKPPDMTQMQHGGPMSFTQEPPTATLPFSTGPTQQPGEFITEVEPPHFNIAKPDHSQHLPTNLQHEENIRAQNNFVGHGSFVHPGQFPAEHHFHGRPEQPLNGLVEAHRDRDVPFGVRVQNSRKPFENFLPRPFPNREHPRPAPQNSNMGYVTWDRRPPSGHHETQPQSPEGIYIPPHIASMPVNPQLMMGLVQQQQSSQSGRPYFPQRPPNTVFPGQPGPPRFNEPPLRIAPPHAPKRPPAMVMPRPVTQPPVMAPSPPPAKPRRRKPGRRRRPKPSAAPPLLSTAATRERARTTAPPMPIPPLTTPYSIQPLPFGDRTRTHQNQRRPSTRTSHPRTSPRPSAATRTVTSIPVTRASQTTLASYANALRLSLSVSQKEDANKTYSWYGGWTKSTPSPSAVKHNMPTAMEATPAPAYKKAFTFPMRILATGQPTPASTTPSTWLRLTPSNSASVWTSVPAPVTSVPSRTPARSSSASIVRVFSSKIGSSVMATKAMPKTTTTSTTTTTTTTTPRPRPTVDMKENIIGNGQDKGFPFEFFTDVGLLLSRTTPHTTPHPQPVYKPAITVREPVTEVVTAISFRESGPVYLPRSPGARQNGGAKSGA